MKVVILNVGGALSAYVEIADNKLIVDLGIGNNFSPVDDFLLPLFKAKNYPKKNGKFILNQVILSHPHKDHIADLASLEKNFWMDLYTTPNDLSTGKDNRKNVNWQKVDDPDSDEVKKLREAYQDRFLPLRVCEPSKMTIGYIYPKDVEDDSELSSESYTNNISIALYIHSGYRIFFPGDVQKAGMKRLLDDNEALKRQISNGVDFLVCPHHGLKSSFSTELFELMKGGKTKKMNIVSEKVTKGKDDKRQVDSRYSSSDYCEGDNNLSDGEHIVRQKKTSTGHIFISDDGTVTTSQDINEIINLF